MKTSYVVPHRLVRTGVTATGGAPAPHTRRQFANLPMVSATKSCCTSPAAISAGRPWLRGAVSHVARQFEPQFATGLCHQIMLYQTAVAGTRRRGSRPVCRAAKQASRGAIRRPLEEDIKPKRLRVCWCSSPKPERTATSVNIQLRLVEQPAGILVRVPRWAAATAGPAGWARNARAGDGARARALLRRRGRRRLRLSVRQ